MEKKGRLYQQYFRNGEMHRAGADVSFADIIKVFGFKSAQVGNWVNKEEQQIAANLFFDAFCDLMDILTVPEQVISLNGTLSLSFGVGGNKYASAHYNSAKRQLALAKNAGAGALAHEWFHAFDHFIATRFLQSSEAHQFASERWLNNSPVKIHPINSYLERCFQHIFLKPDSDDFSLLFENSVTADNAAKSFYYSRPQEVCARAFEAFIQDQPVKNAFLVQGTKQSNEAKLGLYPQKEQRRLISKAFNCYFTALGKALESKVR